MALSAHFLRYVALSRRDGKFPDVLSMSLKTENIIKPGRPIIPFRTDSLVGDLRFKNLSDTCDDLEL